MMDRAHAYTIGHCAIQAACAYNCDTGAVGELLAKELAEFGLTIVPVMSTPEMIAAGSAVAIADEPWSVRRKIDKSGYEVFRFLGGVNSEESLRLDSEHRDHDAAQERAETINAEEDVARVLTASTAASPYAPQQKE